MAEAGGERMHAAMREEAIFRLVAESGFVTFRELERELAASPATIRRDLDRLANERRIVRVHGGAKLPGQSTPSSLSVPFHEITSRNRHAKEAIGKAAAALCQQGEGVIVDGGSTTLQMCPHLDGLGLQVLTNSLDIIGALLPHASTRITVPGGAVFRDQKMILSATGDDLIPRFHASKLFMSAAAVGSQGVMQADVVLVAAQSRLIVRAERLILLVDSSKFEGSSGHVVCDLSEIDVLVTDAGIQKKHKKMLTDAGIKVVVAG